MFLHPGPRGTAVFREVFREARGLGTGLAVLAVAAGTLLGCASSDGDATGTTATTATPATSVVVAEQPFPDVIDAIAASDGDAWRFDVTISSPYDTPERYADAWRVVAPDGTVLGVRELLHDHQFEQPFTRSLTGVEIPDDVDTVTIEGRDLVNGWGGATLAVALDR